MGSEGRLRARGMVRIKGAYRDEKVWDAVESVPTVVWEGEVSGELGDLQVLGRDEAGFVCLFAE